MAYGPNYMLYKQIKSDRDHDGMKIQETCEKWYDDGGIIQIFYNGMGGYSVQRTQDTSSTSVIRFHRLRQRQDYG